MFLALLDLYAGRHGGQGLMEYALILGLVSLLAVSALTLIGPGVANMMSGVVSAL